MEKTERPEGLIERVVYALEMIETYLGRLVSTGIRSAPAGEFEDPPMKPLKDKKPAAEKKETTSAEVVPTLDEVRDALQTYNDTFGREGAIALLKGFNAQNVSALPEARRQEFIDKCLK